MTPEDKKLLSQCRIDTYKSSGPGGQHAAKADTGVRLTHLPTKIRVTSTKERSQYLNKKICLERLKKKLAEKRRVRKRRIPTKKPKSAKEKVLKEKKKRSMVKQLRSSTFDE